MLATELLRFIHETVCKLGPRIELHVRVVVLGPARPLSLSRHGCHFAAGSTPFDPFGELDAMDILKVKYHLQDGLESVDTFPSRMRAFGRFAIFEPLDMAVDMCFPFFSVEELLHSCGGGKPLIPQTERAIPRAGKGSAVDERIALDGKRFRPSQVVLIVTVPVIFAEDPFSAVEAQLGEAAGGHEFPLQQL